MTAAVTPMSLAGSVVHDTRHICAFFNDEDEEYRVLLPFINDGLAVGDQAIHVVGADPFFTPPQQFLRDLRNRRAAEDTARQDGAM
jgi:hypothetical protein